MELSYTSRLYELRKERNISQTKIADDLGICRRSVGQIENGEQNLSLDMAYRIAAYLKADIKQVFPEK